MSRPDDSRPPDSTEIKPSVHFHKDAATLDQYRLVERIGEGSFGEVWKAIKGDAEVALKILKTSMTSEETQRELKSLEVLQELKHQYLVQTYDFWSNGDQLFIEMELANNGSLKDRLKAWQSAGRKGIPPGELLKYFSEIAAALDYLHGQRPRRFLHRDVKPANILLVGGSAKLADFGLLRKVAGDHTGTKTQGGTPVFMAPESIKSDVFSPHTDLYSLAVTYAELRQGKLPFSGTTEYQVCNNILSSQPELSDDLYPGECLALLKALNKDPDQRHATCGEFVAALQAAIPREEAGDVPGEATVLPVASSTVMDAGTAPRNAFRRSSTTMPARAAQTQVAADSNEPAEALPAPPTRTTKTPLLVAIALLILAGMGSGIWLFLNQADPQDPPFTRKLEIKSMPPGATVYVNDQRQEQKTNAVFAVPAAAFKLRLARTDYQDAIQQVGPDQTAVEVTLASASPPSDLHKLDIQTTPPGAIVYINTVRQERPTNGVYDVPVASFQLRVELAKFKVFERTIERGTDHLETIKLDPILPPASVRKMEIKSMPKGAAVFINDAKQTRTTDGVFEVPDGPFDLRLEMPNHNIIQKKIGPKELTFEAGMIPSRTYALLIGVNQPTKQLPDFLHAAADVAELGRTLVASGIPTDDVQMLRQVDGEEAALPLADTIRKSLVRLMKNATEADTVVLVLVGHVVAFPGEVSSYFCPAESNFNETRSLIPLDEIFRQLQQSPAKNKLVILDGWRTDLFAPLSPADGTKFLRDRVKDLRVPAGVALFASCSEGERGNQHPLLPHGLFVHALTRGLQGAASVAPGRQIRLDTLADFTTRLVSKDALREYKLRQSPDLLDADGAKNRIHFKLTEALRKVNEGVIALEEKQYDQALAAFNDAAAKNPSYLDIYTGRALAHYYKGKDDPEQYEQAIQDCQHVLKTDPHNAYAYGYLAQIALKVKRGTPQEQAKEFQLALKYHKLDIDLDPQWAMAYNARGVTYAAQHDYKQAIKDYTEAIRLDPNLKFPYENRGFAYTVPNVENHDAALADFQKAIELNPTNALNYYRRGGVYRAKDQFDHALNDLNEAIKLDSTNANYFYRRAVVQVSQKDFDSAIENFTKTLSIAMKPDKETFYGRGYAYNEKGVKTKDADCYDKAIEDLTAALKLSPKYVFALYVRGVAYENKALLKMNDAKLLDLAIEDFNQAIAQSPNHAKAYYSRGQAFQAKGLQTRADADFKMARQLGLKADQ